MKQIYILIFLNLLICLIFKLLQIANNQNELINFFKILKEV